MERPSEEPELEKLDEFGNLVEPEEQKPPSPVQREIERLGKLNRVQEWKSGSTSPTHEELSQLPKNWNSLSEPLKTEHLRLLRQSQARQFFSASDVKESPIKQTIESQNGRTHF